MDMLLRGCQYKSYPQTTLKRLATHAPGAFKVMAMALSCSCSSALAASLSSLSLTAAATSSPPQWKPALAPLSGALGNSIALSSGFRQRDVVVVVRATEDVVEASTSEAEAAPAIVSMLSEADVLKKKAKKAELRRRRLVRKRKLRKKGKWPPSKMAKLKNV